MQRKKLGAHGPEVTVLGFGAWAIGSQWGPQDDELSKQAIGRALDLGYGFIDTAYAYGEGRSERLIAQVFAERKMRVAVATKVPPKDRHWAPPLGTPIKQAFPPEYIVESCEKSLKNLRTDCLDLLQLHTWCADWNATDDWYEAMVRLRKDGKIRGIGISVSDERPDEANDTVAMGRIDSIQVIYNILDQEARQNLFPLALKHQVGIIARVPLASGALSGKFREDTVFPEGDWRRDFLKGETLRQMVAKVHQVQEAVGSDEPLAVRALQFCVQEEAVTCVIPGIRTPQQAEQNARAQSAPPLTDAQRQALYALRGTPFPGSPG